MRLYKNIIEARQTDVSFSRSNTIIMPTWFPWIFIGGFIFIMLSFIASKYQDRDYKTKQFMQDFISGSIVIGFTGVLMPDVFPTITIPTALSSVNSIIGGSSDMDLQVGPPRLVGK